MLLLGINDGDSSICLSLLELAVNFLILAEEECSEPVDEAVSEFALVGLPEGGILGDWIGSGVLFGIIVWVDQSAVAVVVASLCFSLVEGVV